jgi:heterotetrameric sarcosine oxidase gamma subunit
VSLEFLDVQAAARSDRFSPIARSPMERRARAAGARFEVRDGWEVAVAYSSAEQEAAALRSAAGWADTSHLGKLELQTEPQALRSIVAEATDGAPHELGSAQRAAGAWWCPLAPSRLLVVCQPSALVQTRGLLEGATEASASLVDVTTTFAALTIAGPVAREVFARFCALDLRPDKAPLGSVRPGSVARQPGVVLHEGQDRFLMLFGWAVAEYMWRQVQEAGRHLGAIPVGIDALNPQRAPVEEVAG